MNQSDVKTFDVVIEATGKAVGKMRNEVTVVLGNDGGLLQRPSWRSPLFPCYGQCIPIGKRPKLKKQQQQPNE
jgi:hypothetical protein